MKQIYYKYFSKFVTNCFLLTRQPCCSWFQLLFSWYNEVSLIKKESFLTVGLSISKKVGVIWFNKSPIKIMKSAFSFMINTFFVCKIIKFLSWLKKCDHVGKRLAKKAKVNLIIYDVTDYTTNNYNTHIAQYLKK